jgi:hypothetical protein
MDANYDDYNDFNDVYDDSMDGDFDSAMESMGWGLDEQYDPSYDSDYGDW